MQVRKIADGLWRWTAPHPDWKPENDRPDGWGRLVGCIYAELTDTVVLIDPLVPAAEPERKEFWSALDRDMARMDRAMLIVVGCVDHGRSVDAVSARYRTAWRRVRVIGDAALRGKASCTLDGTLDDAALPRGLKAIRIAGLSPGETAFVLEPWHAAVFADAVIGAGDGRVRIAPPSWGVKTPEGRAHYDREFRPSLRIVADTHPQILLPSHGEPVLTGGATALDDAISGPPWGD